MNLFKSTLVEKLQIKGPLFVAPMAGGPTTPRLVAATSNAGALSFLGGAYMTPEELNEAIVQTQSLTNHSFGINLFVPAQPVSLTDVQIQKAIHSTQTYRKELNLLVPNIQPPYEQNFHDQIQVVLRAKPKAFSFIFGLLDHSILNEFKKRGIITMGTATCIEEALLLEESGVDAVIAQGVDSGGHRGMFSAEDSDPLIGTMSLTQMLVNKLQIPVVAAGGIMNGQGIAAVLQLGAQAAQLGTAFLLCDEAGTSKPYRETLLSEQKRSTQMTRAFSGRWARGLCNKFMEELESQASSILPFPAQNAFTRDIRNQAVQQNKPEYMSLWAGTGVNLIRSMPAAKLVEDLFREMKGT